MTIDGERPPGQRWVQPVVGQNFRRKSFRRADRLRADVSHASLAKGGHGLFRCYVVRTYTLYPQVLLVFVLKLELKNNKFGPSCYCPCLGPAVPSCLLQCSALVTLWSCE